MSTKIPVLPMVLDLPWALSTRFVHPPSAPFLCQKLPSLSLFGLSKNGEKTKNVFKSNVYQTNFLTKQKTAEVTACESP